MAVGMDDTTLPHGVHPSQQEDGVLLKGPIAIDLSKDKR